MKVLFSKAKLMKSEDVTFIPTEGRTEIAGLFRKHQTDASLHLSQGCGFIYLHMRQFV